MHIPDHKMWASHSPVWSYKASEEIDIHQGAARKESCTSLTLDTCTLITTEGPELFKTYLQFTLKIIKLPKVEENKEVLKPLLDLFLNR